MSDLTAEFLQYCERITTRKQELSTLLSNIDQEVNGLYHVIEYVPMPNIEKVQIFDKLRTALNLRREIKDDLSVVSNIHAKIKPVMDIDLSKSSVREKKYQQESFESYRKIFGKPAHGDKS
jgi:vacuolar-type H+-ATPase subunit I/STV1